MIVRRTPSRNIGLGRVSSSVARVEGSKVRLIKHAAHAVVGDRLAPSVS